MSKIKLWAYYYPFYFAYGRSKATCQVYRQMRCYGNAALIGGSVSAVRTLPPHLSNFAHPPVVGPDAWRRFCALARLPWDLRSLAKRVPRYGNAVTTLGRPAPRYLAPTSTSERLGLRNASLWHMRSHRDQRAELHCYTGVASEAALTAVYMCIHDVGMP